MKHEFYKYHGTGNDFIIIDNRKNTFDKNDHKTIKHLCNRHFGIGADGLILLENHSKYDFKMIYYNADGNTSSMCGNGGRCITAFAKLLGIIKNKTTFEAIDGLHQAVIKNNLISLLMQNVTIIENYNTHSFLNTGSPHHIEIVEELENLDVKKEGAKIRYSETYNNAGVNVNFVKKITNNTFQVRTYERGVEAETLSCGTGVTAVALAMYNLKETTAKMVTIETQGGTLHVTFNPLAEGFNDIWLTGPTSLVFKGEIQ